jgi:S1-C subfamily serine protease
VIVALVALMAIGGAMQGFIVGALTLVGFIAGAFAGARLAPLLLADGSASPYAPVFGLVGALFLGGLVASGLGGIGAWLRERVRIPGAGVVDGLLGGLLSACVGLGIAWLFGAVALQTPGARELRRDIQRSAVLRQLNTILPPSGPLLNALARFDPFPSFAGPALDVPPPTSGIGSDPDVRAAFGSVVRIVGTACGLGVEGSGWVAGPDLVVTNAHVVAGEDDTQVERDGRSPGLDATAVHFDPRNDVAVLRVPGIGRPALRLASELESGSQAAVLGYPQDGPFRVRAARLARAQTVLSSDAYGRGPVRRSVLPFRGLVQPGNSGGPLVDSAGRVAGTVFAATTSGPRGGYAVPADVVRKALADAGSPVSTGPCTR